MTSIDSADALALARYELCTAGDFWSVALGRLTDYLAARLQAEEGGRLLADAGCVGYWRSLPFDSKTYSLPMGRVEWVAAEDLWDPDRERVARNLVEAAEAAELRHLTWRINAADYPLCRLVERLGFRYAGGFCGLARAVEGDEFRTHADVGTATSDDLPQLQEIVQEAFSSGTRFHQDPALSAVGTERLHNSWMANCLNGVAADSVLVLRERGGPPLGFISVQIDRRAISHLGESRGSIGLFAVAPKARGKGVGSALLGSALCWFQSNGAVRVSVGTEATNLGAQKSYLRAGFLPVLSCLTMTRSQA